MKKQNVDSVGVKDAADMLNLSENSIRRLANEGKLECWRDHANRRTFEREYIETERKRRASA
jgi:predicted site-specific integrase-resolvase